MPAAAITPKRALSLLRRHALSYPEAVEDFPWGDQVIKVKGKIFVFLGAGKDGGFGISAKLPGRHELALTLKFVTPTGYGFGKAGWVTAQLKKGQKIPIDLFEDRSARATERSRRRRCCERWMRGPHDLHGRWIPPPASGAGDFQPTSGRRDPRVVRRRNGRCVDRTPRRSELAVAVRS